MGANFQTMILPGGMIRNEVKKRFARGTQECRAEYGHDPYNGTWSTCSGLSFENKTFDSEDDAYEWLMDRAQKWDDALCVTVKEKWWRPRG